MKKRLIFFITVLLVACSTNKPTDREPIDELPPEQIPEITTSVFNGSVLPEDQDTYQAFAIMISNSSQARPQSGIGLADVVYEITMEGWGITRFMAIFASEHPTKVGPVRSARIPFVRLAQEWGIAYAHYGAGSTGEGRAVELVKEVGFPVRFDGHTGVNSQFFSRDKARKAPHNAYFDSEAALVKIPELEYAKRFEFDEVSNVNDEAATSISMRYASSVRVKYGYDEAKKSYDRFINDKPMMDAYTDKQVSVTNIIALHAPHRAVESVSYILVDFIGTGKAEYFVGGKHEVGTWKKDSFTDITKYFDSEGNEIVLLPGNTWIQVVHDKIAIAFE